MEKQAGMLEDRLARLSSDLGLDNIQVNQLRTAFNESLDQNQELMRLWQEGADPQLLGETKQSNALAHRAALESILTPEQLETYRRSAGGSGAGKGD